MILVTTNTVAGREITAVLGLVRGNSVRARHAITDLKAALTNLVGGEVREYTKLLAEVREQAIDRMVAEARAQGADAIIGMRFATSEISRGCAEFLAYGTAVRLDEATPPARNAPEL